MRRFIVLVLAGALVLGLGPLATSAGADDAADAALAWLRSAQDADGSFGPGDPFQTSDAVLALGAPADGDPTGARELVEAARMGGASPVDWLGSWVAANDPSVGQAAAIGVAVWSIGLDPRSIGGKDLVGIVDRGYDPASGRYGRVGVLSDTYWAVLALASWGRQIPDATIAFLKSGQAPNGLWSFDAPGTTWPGIDDTAFVLEALAAAGVPRNDPVVEKAIEAFRGGQEQGGWAYAPPADPENFNPLNANSTAAAWLALLAYGEDIADWEQGDATPDTFLRGLQEDSGRILWAAGDPGFLATLPTSAGIQALLGSVVPPRSAELPALGTQPAQSPPATDGGVDTTRAVPATAVSGTPTFTG